MYMLKELVLSGLCAKKALFTHFILSGVFFVPTRGFLFLESPFFQTYSHKQFFFLVK